MRKILEEAGKYADQAGFNITIHDGYFNIWSKRDSDVDVAILEVEMFAGGNLLVMKMRGMRGNYQ